MKMASIFDKLRNITLSNIHTLLDTVTDWNAIGSVKQRVRDMEEAKKTISVEAAVAKSAVKEKGKEIANKELQIKTTDENITLILTDADPTNDHMAEPLEARLIGYETELSRLQEELANGQKLAVQLTEAAEKVKSEHAKALARLNELIALDNSAKAQETAADALEAVADITSSNAGSSVDNVTKRIKDRSTRAGARMDLALGSMTDQLDVDVVALQAKDRIAKRRAAFQAEANPSVVDTETKE